MTTWHDDAFDADDLAGLSDDLDLFGGAGDGFDLDALDPDALEEGAWDGGSDAAQAEALAAHATGVRFEALALFAQPLFERYGVDVAEAFALVEAPEQADASAVTLLETARLLWAYFSLADAERAGRRQALLTHCYGADADVEAWEDLADLLAAMEAAWAALTPEERAEAEATAAPTLDFDALLAAGGADAADENEARALFALPLLDDPDVQADPARFEAALQRADAYWTLAQQPDRAEHLGAFVRSLAPTPDALPAVRAEAEQMLARYDELFGS